jgi:diguanylate cyclase (GGDEF)-like protein
VKGKIRREDCFARYGGEEFAIVLPEIDGAGSAPFAEKIRQIVEKTEFKFENTRIPGDHLDGPSRPSNPTPSRPPP